ncbi:CHASE domain-containing protein [Lutibacter sp.]|uniref:CHASE domain-containing protein n=1 Tax=Lutibacter sp. TaxID=1925666 RepID=UPI001A213D19|nr:CHASE domain-containing protein [Lutibacter sp.]MBI9041531.1 CHASE domain-containing protein [Lutibacter sp.]
MKKKYTLVPVLFVLIIGIVISVSIHLKTKGDFINAKNSLLTNIITTKKNTINQELKKTFQSIEVLKYFFEMNSVISREEFKNYTSPILTINSGIKAISWVPKIEDNRRFEFESKGRDEHIIKDFFIKELNTENKFTKAKKRNFYFSVNFIEPIQGNKNAIGYDIFSNIDRQSTIIKAVETRTFQLTPVINLVQDSTENSVLGILPVYDYTKPTKDSISFTNVKGLISVVCKINNLINTAFYKTSEEDIDLYIYDITNGLNENIYKNGDSIDEIHTQKRIIEIGGRIWELHFTPKPVFYKFKGAYNSLLTGLLITLILALLLIFLQIKGEKSKEILFRFQKEQKNRKKAEQSLQESEEKFKILYHESPDMLVSISPTDALILQCNETLLQKTGYLREEIIGTSIFKMYHKSCIDEVKKAFQQFMETGEVLSKELLLKTKNGSKIEVLLNVKSVKDKTGKILFSISSWRDISSWKKTQEKVRKSEERYSRLLTNLEAGIVVHAPDTSIILSNKKASELLGLTVDQLKGKTAIDPYWKFIDQNSIPIAPEDYPVNRILNSRKPFQDLILGVIKSELNNIVWLTVSGFLEINDTNEIDEIVINFTEITQQKTANEEVAKLNAALEDRVAERTLQLELSEGALLNLVDDLNMQTSALDTVNKKLASINAEMETFTYSVSHDLKAPLRGIDGYSKLLIDLYKNDLNEEAQGFLKNIRTGTLQMNLLIEDLLSYSRIERQEFQIKNVPLKPLINDLLTLLSGEIKKSNIQIKTSFSNNFMLLADSNGLKLALRNLLDNAIKFSSKSKNPKIEIGSSENSTHWLIFVRDNGVGFDMKYHDRIFKIFQRLHLPEEYEGTGIGLAMVEKAMHRMNGSIWAESELNIGTCFYLEFKK